MSYAVKLCRMALLLLIYFFDWWGFIGGIIGVVALIASTRPLVGKGYLYPPIPSTARTCAPCCTAAPSAGTTHECSKGQSPF